MNESDLIARLAALEKEIAALKSGSRKKRLSDTDANLHVERMLSAFFNHEGAGAFIVSPAFLLEWMETHHVNGYSGFHRKGSKVVWISDEMQFRTFEKAFHAVMEARKPAAEQKKYIQLTF